MDWSTLSSNTSNESDDTCRGNDFTNSCTIDTDETLKRNVITGIRIIVSFFSLCGSMSIIISVLCRRQLKSSKVLPLFILSIADSLLSLSLIIGGIMWWTAKAASGWCLTTSLFTVVFVCSSANLTVVYSCVCYSDLKKNSIHSLLGYVGSSQSQKFSVLKAVVMYSCAWLLPFLLVALSFGPLEGVLHIQNQSFNCTCWCLPFFINVVPMANPADQGSIQFYFKMEKVVSVLGFIVGTNYLIVFISLVVMYSKILLRIRKIGVRNSNQQYGYASVENIIFRGQKQAKKRIIYFLMVFIVTGFANLFLSYAMAIGELEGVLQKGTSGHRLGKFDFVIYILQSLTLPLQGFLNALVYGWTRSDFVRRIGYTKTVNHSKKNDGDDTDGRGLTYSGSSFDEK